MQEKPQEEINELIIINKLPIPYYLLPDIREMESGNILILILGDRPPDEIPSKFIVEIPAKTPFKWILENAFLDIEVVQHCGVELNISPMDVGGTYILILEGLIEFIDSSAFGKN